MVHTKLYIGTSVLIFVSYLSMTLSGPQGRACYHAKICVHNAVEKCGIDSKGNLRRFFDSCDLKEYNCLKGTDFQKTTPDKCKSLPPIKDDQEKPEKPKYKPKADTDEKSKVNDEDKSKDVNLNNVTQQINLKVDNIAINQHDKLISKNQKSRNVELDLEKSKTSDQQNQDNNDDVSKGNESRELNEVLEEKEVSEENVLPKKSIVLNNKADMADDVQVNDDFKESGHESAIETENDKDDSIVIDDHNND